MHPGIPLDPPLSYRFTDEVAMRKDIEGYFLNPRTVAEVLLFRLHPSKLRGSTSIATRRV
jgi:hypothetical protein